jgi:hypothetical protein
LAEIRLLACVLVPKIGRNADSSAVQAGSKSTLTIAEATNLSIAGLSVSRSSGTAGQPRAASSAASKLPRVAAVLVAFIIAAGWLASGVEHLTPESGLGYWLGIAGSAAMLCLLVYSFRKRFKAARSIGSVRFWFNTHMMLGIAGPLLILFHTNFKLGPLNSNIALFSMLIVACSGVVGRFIYGKIHMGLHGRRARAKELLAEADKLNHYLGEQMKAGALVSRELNAFSDSIASEVRASVLTSLWSGAVLAVRARRMRASLLTKAKRVIRIEARTSGWSRRQRRDRQQRIVELVTGYSEAVLKAAELAFYERLFALWHVLHLPLFFLMLAAGLIHVWAVHQY